MDLTVSRLRVIANAITARLDIEVQSRRVLTVWQTRTITQFIAATVPTEKGKKNPLIEAAAKVGEALVPTTAERGRADSSHEPAPGSFERFMGAMSSVR